MVLSYISKRQSSGSDRCSSKNKTVSVKLYILDMKYGIRAILLMGFGTLVALIGVLGFGAFRRAGRIESEIAAIHDLYQRSAHVLSETKEDTYLSGIMVRDYLLDPSPTVAPKYKEELVSIRSSLARQLESLDQLIGRDEGRVLERLDEELQTYWDSLNPVFDWTPQQKGALATSFLEEEIIPAGTRFWP